MNVTRHEKVNRIAEAGQNLCGNAFFSNAERIVAALESDSCRELNISFSMTVKASNKDELGIGKIEFENPSLVITNNHKYKDSFDDVVLDFVEPELPGIDDNQPELKKEKNVKGQVIDASRQLTTEIIIYKDMSNDKTYFAGQGLGDDAFMTFKGLPTDGSRHRYVNKALPVRTSLVEAETDLIAYALKKMWKRVEQESEKQAQSDEDTMKVEKTLTETFEDGCAAGKIDTGCCFCENENCNLRQINMGDAVKCELSKACSKNCPRLKKEEPTDLTLEPEEDEYIFGRAGMAFCDNAHKLAKLGFTVIKLELEAKDILEWHNGMTCFRPRGERFKTQAAAKREFDSLLKPKKNAQVFLNIDKFNTWELGCVAGDMKFFRGYREDKLIRFQTEGFGWGKPEKFNTESQYDNRRQELREKLDHFEV